MTDALNANGMQYRAWLIDLDGTLYRSLPVKLAMALELLTAGPRVWKIIRTFRRQHEALRASGCDRGADPFRQQLQDTAQGLDCPLTEVEPVIERWMFERPCRWLKRARRESLVVAIRQHRARGGLTALVSDYPAQRKLRALEMIDLFDVVIASGESDGPTALKPEPDGYLAAAARLQVLPSECLVIGDRTDADGLAAERAGMSFRHVHDQSGRAIYPRERAPAPTA